jgi:hypothetical protein
MESRTHFGAQLVAGVLALPHLSLRGVILGGIIAPAVEYGLQLPGAAPDQVCLVVRPCLIKHANKSLGSTFT